MRLPLATDLKTRPSAPDKDARLTNAYVEVKNGQEVVRKRPAASGGVSVGTGTAQGGIGLSIGGVDYIYTVNGDTGALDTLATAGTSWASGTLYIIGDHVSVDFVDYWPTEDNIGNDPTTSPDIWSRSYIPPKPRYTTSPSAGNVSVSVSETTTNVNFVFTRTRTYLTYAYGTDTLLDSGSGTEITVSGGVSGGVVIRDASVTWDGLICTTAQIATLKSAWAASGVIISYPSGYDRYLLNGSVSYTYNGSVFVVSGGSGSGFPY
jgi:hypothetical protein